MMPPAYQDAHRYKHLYPPLSFFHLPNDPTLQAAGHHANYSLVWSMLHGTQPPLHMFSSSRYAMECEQHQQTQQPQHDQPQQHKSEQEREHDVAHHQHAQLNVAPTPLERKPQTVAMGEERMDESIEQPRPPTAQDAAAASAAVTQPTVAAQSVPPFPSSSTYTREQLLSCHRLSLPMPASLSSIMNSSSPAHPKWLRGLISIESLEPECHRTEPHPLEAALRQEMRRDADLTGVEEYANEWWLPTYSDMNQAKAAHGRGGKGGRGKGKGGRGGRGGSAANRSKQSPARPAIAAASSSAAVSPAASTPVSSSSTSTSTPSQSRVSTLGGGRKGGQKRGRGSEKASEPGSLGNGMKRPYLQTNVSRLFAGIPTPTQTCAPTTAPTPATTAPHASQPAPPPSQPSSSNQTSSVHSTVAVSTSSPVAAPTLTAPGPPPPRALPAKSAVFSQDASGGISDSVFEEIVRNIQQHKATRNANNATTIMQDAAIATARDADTANSSNMDAGQ